MSGFKKSRKGLTLAMQPQSAPEQELNRQEQGAGADGSGGFLLFPSVPHGHLGCVHQASLCSTRG